MPNSLRAKISKLAYKGLITREDADRIREALSKQIPRKPTSKYEWRKDSVCPACETERTCRIIMGWERHCPDCGQMIDRSYSK